MHDRHLRLPHRRAGDVLALVLAGRSEVTAADVMEHDAAILALPPRERRTLRWALLGHLTDPADLGALRGLWGDPDPPTDPWPPTTAAQLLRWLWAASRNVGWRALHPVPPALADEAIRLLRHLDRPEREMAAGVLAGALEERTRDDVLEQAGFEDVQPAAPEEAAAAFRALPAEVRQLLVADDGRARFRGAVAALRAHMPESALLTWVGYKDERDPVGMLARARAAAQRGRPA